MVMAYNIKTKNGMAFNLDDPFQEKMYEHICKVPNVSGYLKRLVGMDMMGTWTTLPRGIQEEVETVEVSDDMMLNLI
jgi:hypothetical protein